MKADVYDKGRAVDVPQCNAEGKPTPQKAKAPARTASAGWLVLQAEMTKLSTNSVQCIIPNATHAFLTLNKAYAVASSKAILDVVTAVRTAQPLGKE